MIELTERLLADAGGWQAMKEARSLHEMGRVIEASWEPPLLRGRVRAGETEYRTGLRIVSRTNLENLCTCREARQRGTICAHALAVGIEILRPRPAALQPATTSERARAAMPLNFAEDGQLLELAVVLPQNLAASWEKNALTVGVEAIIDGRRILLSAVDRKSSYRASEADRRMIEQLAAANDGALPGVMILPRVMFQLLLEALAGHPRVSLGKSASLSISAEPIARPTALSEGTAILSEGSAAWLLCGKSLSRLARNDAESKTSDLPAPSFPDPGVKPVFHLKLEGSLNYLAAELESRVGTRRTTLSDPRAAAVHPDEQAAIARLLKAGFSPPNRDGQFVLKGEAQILAFFATELPRLEQMWTVSIGARFEHVTREIERVRPRFEIKSSGENWFDLNVELASGSGERFSAAEIQRLLQSGQRSVRLKNKKLAIFDTPLLDEFQELLRDCDPRQLQPGLYRMNAQHAAYVAEFASGQGNSLEAPPTWSRWIDSSAESGKMHAVPLGDLENVLRAYQMTGVNWLNFLKINNWSGLLADEMGLGKTIQILAFLRTLRGTSLVVCPSSLVFNWQREAARFAPDLQTVAVVGSDRAVALRLAADLYITSYPLLRRDAALYREMQFETVILDEAQHIKNPDSQNAQAATALRARHRFALTGTPIENSIRDIWSLMNFLMPGYLGSREDFRDRFERPIENEPGGPVHRRLVQRLRPFILRRTKREVLKELPEKIEQVAYCELNESQRSAYSQLSEETRRQVATLAGAPNPNRARMTMLTALLRLRQTCCDLRLLRPEGPETEISGKVEMLLELLAEAVDGGHRVLVFSQFATMLGLLREAIAPEGYSVCYLDGQTKEREAEVDRFQAGEADVFLISLKAGGTGLNLTAADTVIHFDPWWNPAIEAQATDRAHRIGQHSVVSSYKLIARNTVEEKILALQQRKKAVIAASLESEEPLMDGLSMEELQELLS